MLILKLFILINILTWNWCWEWLLSNFWVIKLIKNILIHNDWLKFFICIRLRILESKFIIEAHKSMHLIILSYLIFFFKLWCWLIVTFLAHLLWLDVNRLCSVSHRSSKLMTHRRVFICEAFIIDQTLSKWPMFQIRTWLLYLSIRRI